MTQVSIIGSGNMGQAIAGLFAKGGNTVQTLGHADTDTAVTGDIVVLAVPHGAVADVIEQRGDQLAGKVVVDITNPVNFQTFQLSPAADSSAAADIASALPRAKVVKAFNTNFAATLATGVVGAQPTTVLIAGDDTDAKNLLAEAVTAGGVNAIDAGPLGRARELEAIGYLQLTLAIGEKLPWTGGFGIAS